MATSKTTSRILHIGLPFLGLAVGLLSRPHAEGGAEGHEVFCNGGQEIHERWASIPAGGIPWKVAAGPVFTLICPGLPPAARDSTLPDAQRPGVQSMTRAAGAWSNVRVPFPTTGTPHVQLVPAPIASSFRFTANPTGYVAWNNFTQNDADRMVVDGTNLVTCWQSAGFWQLLGGPSVLAAAFVTLQGGLTTGNIIEGDIAINARTVVDVNTGQPAWSFVERNSHHSKIYATHTFDRFNQSYIDPELGYADLQGVLAHEFGHVAGLAHSLLDGRQNGATGLSDFPTMFPFAQVEPYAEDLNFFLSESGGVSNYLTVPGDGSQTSFGGLAGKSARTLELDDIASLAETYPGPGLDTFLATISGRCFLGSLASPRNAVHVVAFRADSPDKLRVGALALSGGNYTLRGLPPGEWYLYAEPVDQSPPPFTASGFYFDGFSVPNYVFQGPTGCITMQPFFTTEFYDSNESFGETEPMRATKVIVAAGQTRTGIDFHLQNSGDALRVRPRSLPVSRASPRGLVISPQGAPPPTVEILLSAPLTHAGRPAFISFATSRTVGTLANQLTLPTLTGAIVQPVTLDSNASALLSINTALLPVQTNWFAQAVILGPSGAPLVTNALNLWMASR